MYLSRISLSPEAERTSRFWRLFESPYRLHQELWHLFSDAGDRRRDFLYRIERTEGRPQVFCLSDRRPTPTDQLWRIESKEFCPALRAGERLRFSLRANPVVTRDRKRHDVVMDAKHDLRQRGIPRPEWPTEPEIAQQAGVEWLIRRGETHGFEVDAAGVRVDRYAVHTFDKPGAPGRVRLATCDFAGLLEVRDVDRFLAAVRGGIGPAKGFGCGLLLCMRARKAAAV
jgi:CRISPR system Cascade subunit CasE